MAGIDFKIIFAEEGGAGPAGKSTDPGKDPATQETAELPGKPPAAEKVKGPKADRWKGDPGPSKTAKGTDKNELAEAVKGLGRFTADQLGLRPVVSTLENVGRHIANLIGAISRSGSGSISGPPASGSRSPAGAAPAAQGAAGMQGLAAAAGPIAAAALPVVVALAGLAAAAYTVKRAFDAIHSEGERLQGYSAELSQAHATSDLRAELADIRRAQRIGPDAARVEDMRSKIMEKVADIGTGIYEKVGELLVKLEPGIDVVINVLGLLADATPSILDKLEAGMQIMSGSPAQIADALKEDPKEKANRERMEKAVTNWIEGKEAEKEDLEDPFMIGLMGQFGQAGAVRAAAGAGQQKAAPALGPMALMGMPIHGVPAGFGGP